VNRKVLYIGVYGAVLVALMVGVGNLFGSEIDWLGQHIQYPDMFRRSFYETGRLIPNFTFDIGAGQSIFNFAYYGFLSPVILLSYFLPFVDMTTYIMVASVVLYLASGILAYLFLKKHFDESRAFIAALLFMSLSPLTYHFHHHIMFVWYIPFLILGLMGIDRLFEKQKSGLFIFAALATVFVNYYYSVGCLICMFVYAAYHVANQEEWNLKVYFKRFARLGFVFCIPVALSGILLAPTAYALMANGRTFESGESVKSLLLPDLTNLIYNPFSLGISGIVVIGIIANLTCKGIKRGEIVLNGFLLFCMICPLFAYLLNGALYVRGKSLIPFSILFIFAFLLFLERMEKSQINIKKTVIGTVILMCLSAIVSTTGLYLAGAVTASVAGFIIFRKNPKVLLSLALVTVVISSAATHISSERMVTVDYYNNLQYDESETLLDSCESGYYRSAVNHYELNTANHVYGKNYYGLSLYSSTSNQLYREFYEEYMGNNEKYLNCFLQTGADNELFFTFMGTKYIIAETDPGFFYKKVDGKGSLNLYENKSAYPLVYKAKNLMSLADLEKSEFPYNAEYLMTHTAVEGDIVADYESKITRLEAEESYKFIQKKEKMYQLTLPKEYLGKLIYLTFEIDNNGENKGNENLHIVIDQAVNTLTSKDWLYYNENTKFDYVISLEDDTVLDIYVSKGEYDIKNLKMYISEPVFETYTEAENLKINSKSEEISCKLSADEGEYLVTTIPYDEGFAAYINGKKVETERVNKAFLGLKLQNGENNVVIKYKAPFFNLGILISLFGVCLLCLELSRKLIFKIITKNREVVMYLIFGALTTVVSLVIYYLCTATVLNPENAVQLQAANVISWIGAVIFAYITNKKYVFESNNSHLSEMLRFFASRVGTLVIDMALMYVLVSLCGFSDLPVKILVQIIVIVGNYILGKFFVFKKESV